jgi:uncharacterized protein YmfQ (DUF2313 family)
MAAPLYSPADYLAALQALMPRGRVWPRDPDALQTKVLAGLTRSYAANNARANYLLQDSFPASALELLPEWEATLGLPSTAAGPAPTVRARQVLVVARLVGADGISPDSFSRYSGMLGYDVSIQGRAPFRCGQSSCTAPLGARERFFQWTITARARPDMPFGAYGPAVLEAEIRRLAPPHAVLTFKFL